MNATTPQVARPDDISNSWRRWLVLAVMSVGTLIVFIDNTVVNTALPAISTDLGASITTLQWIVDAYVLALVGLLLLGGSLGDRYGRTPVDGHRLLVFSGGAVVAGTRDELGAAHPRPRPHGRRRRLRPAGHALDHHQHLPARRAHQGHRHLDRRGRSGHRPRPGPRRLPRRQLRLGRRVLAAPAGRRPRARGHGLRA